MFSWHNFEPDPILTGVIFLGTFIGALAFLWVCVRGLKGKP